MAAALAHAEQTQAAARARESDAPFHPGFDPGYEVPALDSPTTMMSEPPVDEAAPAQATNTGAAAEDHRDAAAERGADAVADADGPDAAVEPGFQSRLESDPTPAVSPADTEATPTPIAEATPEAPVVGADIPSAGDATASEPSISVSADTVPEAEPPLTVPPTPWPTLDHSAFDDAPVHAPSPAPPALQPSQVPHSSLDPAAALAPSHPSGMPPYGAYSAKASWPPLRPADAPSTRPMAEASAATPGAAATEDFSATDAAPDDVRAEAVPEASDLPRVSADTSPDRAADASEPFLQPEASPNPDPLPLGDPVPSASGFLRAEDPADPEAEAWAAQARDVIEHDLGVTLRNGTPEAVARETATRHWLNRPGASAGSSSKLAGTAASGPVFAPDFLRHTREREQARAPGSRVSVPGNRRSWMRAAAVVLGFGILVQGIYLARSQIAGSMPVLRPVLEAACAPFGCDVPPWRDLEALRIDSSQLQKQDEASDVYLLAVTLRNQGRATTALPAIELVMTDLQDQLLLRRVLLPAEYLEPVQRGFAATGLRAGSELPVRVRFRTQQAAANYRVLIFYP